MALPRTLAVVAFGSLLACGTSRSPSGPSTAANSPDSLIQSADAIAHGPLPLPFPPAAPTGVNSAAMGLWMPASFENCSQAIHDAYRVVGPDGKWYPTWHPPIDPGTGCSFGHEHGRDPRGSALHPLLGPIVFGAANEALDT